MRRRGRVRRSGMRRQTDWIPQTNDGAVLQTSNVALIALVDELDIEEHQDHLTIERVVGEVVLCARDSVGATCPAIIYMGIIVSDADSGGGVTPWGPASSTDAESEWLWRRMYHSLVPTLGAESYQPSQFDIHVRRKMSQRQALLLNITAFTSSFPATPQQPTDMDIWMNIRTLVKLF